MSGGCGFLTIEGLCQDDVVETFPVSPSTQYWVAVGKESAGAGGSFSLDITASLIVVGDDCGIESLILGTPFDGSTTCASAPTDGFCSLSTTNDHAVYYDFTVTGLDNVDLSVEMTAGTGVTGTSASEIVIEIY